jgi:hypothetical protein
MRAELIALVVATLLLVIASDKLVAAKAIAGPMMGG